MTTEEILEAVNSLQPLFGDEFVSVSKAWEEGDSIELNYAYKKYFGDNENGVPALHLKKVQRLMEFIKKNEDYLDLLPIRP